MEEKILKRILAIDFGLKRIGIALSDPLKIFAYAFETISNDANKISRIREIIEEQNIDKIILGLPLKESGDATEITKEVLKFKELLEKSFTVEVILKDERYSSSIALENIRQSVNKKSKRKDKGLIDKNAAAVILQDYLSELK